jgi:hypothetical protein
MAFFQARLERQKYTIIVGKGYYSQAKDNSHRRYLK